MKPVELTLPRLAPEFDGYRLVQMGDIHLDDWAKPDRLRRTVELVNEQRPDLVAVTGDFLSRPAGRLIWRSLVEGLGGLGARDGVVAVLGNHDYKAGAALVRRSLRACGIVEMANDVLTLRRGEAALHVAGVDDVMEG